jgi:hypothetical protein
MKLNVKPAHFNAVQKLLRSSKEKVNLTKAWAEIHDAYDIGEIRSNKLVFNAINRQILKRLILDDCGLCPMHDNLDKSRLEMSRKTHNEKLSKKSVFGELCRIASIGPIELYTGVAMTPARSFLMVDLNDIVVEKLKRVLIVENGALISSIHEINYQKISSYLVIYKGHSEDARNLNEWLTSLPSTIIVTGYLDFDLAGIDMAISHGYDEILIPKDLSHFTKDTIKSKWNKELEYFKQVDSLNINQWLKKMELNNTSSLVNVSKFLNVNRLAYTQEFLTSSQIQLMTISI